MLQTVSDAYGAEAVLGGSSSGTRVSRSALRAMAGAGGEAACSEGESSDGYSSAGGATPVHRTPSPVRGVRELPAPVAGVMGVLAEDGAEDCGDPIAPPLGEAEPAAQAAAAAAEGGVAAEDDAGAESE